MAARRKPKARDAQLAFEALSIEGGLLSPEWLSKVAQLQAGAQAEADYRIPKGLNLRDELGRYWRIAQAHWADFRAGREATADAQATAHRFVLALLRDAFGFTALVAVEPAVLQERSYPIGHATLGGRIPVVVAPAGSGLDTLSPSFGDGVRRRSAFGLAQEYLNAQEGALWGLASDGASLRIVRDNASLTRPAWIEADLQRIFTEERYADFAALWLLCHETRFGRQELPGEAAQAVTECVLEAWRTAGREEGTRAREHLRRGVEEALVALGQGFLAHPENVALRADLQRGALPVKDYFNQLLRLVYRLIFLLTVEERGLLHPDGTRDATRALYERGYGLRRLRERAVKRSAHDRFADLWEATKVVFRGVAAGEPRLGLPALAGLFAANQCPALDGAKLENRALLLAVFKLAWLREDGSLARVNWRDMGPEELGSVYESLLELVPQIAKEGRQFGFAAGGETKGNARKTTGSYYTPDSLVQVLLDSALEPVIADTIAQNPGRATEALLGLSIVDPACGSGHFLLAAARRLAAHVARLSANGTPSAAEYRHALRQVVGRCIFGVDLNPMAVELCKVSLWMEAVEPGLPLTFLNSHIQHGNALLGTTPELMAKGIPDAAWDPIEGDDRKIASALKKRNKPGVGGQRPLDLSLAPTANDADLVARAVSELEAALDTDADALAQKASRWDGILDSPAYRHEKLVADAWCAAFVWPKQPGPLAEAAPTSALWRQLRDGQGQPPALMTKTVGELAEQYQFFHWNLQFPQVFAKGGFDVVLGNPPWDQVQLDPREWFASRDTVIADAQHQAARDRAIRALQVTNPTLHSEFLAATRRTEGFQAFAHRSGKFPLGSQGRLNTSTLFVETASQVLRVDGLANLIVPSGIATDSFTQELFRNLVDSGRLRHVFAFENEERIFPAVTNKARFCLLKLGGPRSDAPAIHLVFFARRAEDVRDARRIVRLRPADFGRLNPNTQTCPTFRWRADAELSLRIASRVGPFVLDDAEDGNPWGFNGLLMFMMNTDSHRFRTRVQMESAAGKLSGATFFSSGEQYLPLLEGKMIYQFDHRFGTYEGATEAHLNKGFLPQFADADHVDPRRVTLPEYWVSKRDVEERLTKRWTPGWFVGWRDISGVEKQRSVVAAIVPRLGAGHTMPVLLVRTDIPTTVCLYVSLNSFIVDYAARQRVGGSHLTYTYLKQLPVLKPAVFAGLAPGTTTSAADWIAPRALELTYTAWDLEAFAHDVGYDGPPFRWDPERRFLLRCELDAAFFHLYGLSRDDTDYVMDTFPIVRKNDEKAHGEYRTKRVILEIYDAMAEAARTGEPYQTRLDPPAADPRVAHAESTRPAWAKKGAS
jgi:hypothetical protein